MFRAAYTTRTRDRRGINDGPNSPTAQQWNIAVVMCPNKCGQNVDNSKWLANTKVVGFYTFQGTDRIYF